MRSITEMWSIFFLLPNLVLSEPIGNQYIAIVPNDDKRVTAITDESSYAKSLVENFEDQFGSKAYPSLLIMKENTPDFLRDIEPIVGFRNCIALSTIMVGHEHFLTSTSSAYPLYSDYFDLYPITLSRKDDGYITRSPSVFGFDNEHQHFKGQTTPGLARFEHLMTKPNNDLFISLEKIWTRRFIRRKKNEWSTTALFRSLEMAYRAAAMPFQNHATIYDYGTGASLWVSALEILSHPRTGNANLLSVIKLIGGYKWENNKVKRRVYKVKYRRQYYQVNLVQKLYKELYDTRNAFLHGNPVTPRRLRPFGNKNAHPITRFAPLIYKVALLSFLDQFEEKDRADWRKQYIAKLHNERYLAKSILKSKK